MKKTNKIFVYGTLKRGHSVRGLDALDTEGTVEFVGDAVTSHGSFSLYDLGPFPTVSPSGTDHIAGEVWNVDDDALGTLDRIEGYPDFYNRMEVDTTQGRAWMYYITNITDYSHRLVKSDTNNIVSWRQK